ncbi:hypothetical protein [Desulfosporosinus sp.]|uniref:hypothetical protein n=1 Tax=Desulfosporosinus sp. TaxID=157907 RepID=UPI0025B80F67|nr:hypothetical protein [Desulfosporosinus sp.]MBC2725380.1 hypothetical protein [Desulfosporosinus sp.]
MLFKQGQIDRERITGAIIIISLVVILMSMLGVRLLKVHVTNIELIDRHLYSIITDNGPVNIGQEDILRIERTYTKAAITGSPVELDKIYTTKGFIYISSIDPFYEMGSQLINSVDLERKPVWIHNSTGSNSSLENRQKANLELVQPFSYSIGTSAKLVPLTFSILSLQSLSLAIGGLALIILIFPLRLDTPLRGQSLIIQEQEFSTEEDQLDVVAK